MSTLPPYFRPLGDGLKVDVLQDIGMFPQIILNRVSKFVSVQNDGALKSVIFGSSAGLPSSDVNIRYLPQFLYLNHEHFPLVQFL